MQNASDNLLVHFRLKFPLEQFEILILVSHIGDGLLTNVGKSIVQNIQLPTNVRHESRSNCVHAHIGYCPHEHGEDLIKVNQLKNRSVIRFEWIPSAEGKCHFAFRFKKRKNSPKDTCGRAHVDENHVSVSEVPHFDAQHFQLP